MKDIILTKEHIIAILRNNPNGGDWFEALSKALSESDITTDLRIAAFMAQTSFESTDYTRLHENLNYSARGLQITWPSRFTAETAALYARKPEKIANKVYANRLGNGSEESGDGWRYRGRGIMQVTGKNNYGACSKAIFDDYRLIDNPELLEDDKYTAVKSACWFWDRNHLETLADNQYITEMTKRINGGYHGRAERLAKYWAALAILRG